MFQNAMTKPQRGRSFFKKQGKPRGKGQKNRRERTRKGCRGAAKTSPEWWKSGQGCCGKVQSTSSSEQIGQKRKKMGNRISKGIREKPKEKGNS